MSMETMTGEQSHVKNGWHIFINILVKKAGVLIFLGCIVNRGSVMVLGLLRFRCLGFVLSVPFSCSLSVAFIRHTWAGNWWAHLSQLWPFTNNLL